MKKLSEFKNEDALDLLADIIDPLAKIFSDKKFEKVFKKGNKLEIAKYLLKNRQKEILIVLARLEDVPLNEYEINVFSLPIKIMEVLSDEDLIRFFAQQGLGMDNASFGSVTETIEETEQK